MSKSEEKIFFGQTLPVISAFALFVAFVLYILFDVWVKTCVVIRISEDISFLKVVLIILKKTIQAIASDGGRNLGLLLAASIGWYFVARRTNVAEREASTSERSFNLAEQTAKTAEQTAKAAEQTAKANEQTAKIAEQNRKDSEKNIANERINLATEQLANEKAPIRLSGINNLEQIAKTHEEDGIRIARVLVSFIRTQAAKNSERTMEDIAKCNLSNLETMDDFSAYRAQRLDIEAAVSTLASIASALERHGYFEYPDSKPKRELCDLRNTDLRGLELNKIDLSSFNLTGVDFSWAWLMETNFTNAFIGHPPCMTKFIRAFLTDAIFNNVIFYADFSDSILTGATFNNARLGQATFDRCNISRTDFKTSKNLTQEQINKTFYLHNDSPPSLPEGFNLPQEQFPIPPAPINAESNNPSTKNDEQNS